MVLEGDHEYDALLPTTRICAIALISLHSAQSSSTLLFGTALGGFSVDVNVRYACVSWHGYGKYGK